MNRKLHYIDEVIEKNRLHHDITQKQFNDMLREKLKINEEKNKLWKKKEMDDNDKELKKLILAIHKKGNVKIKNKKRKYNRK